MNKNHPKFLAFHKKNEIRFQEELPRLSTRARGILESAEMLTWDAFYYQFLIIQDVGEFDRLRNSGPQTKNELLTFTRTILNPDGQYTRELEKFEYDKSILSSYAKSILRYFGISAFETFYYRLVIEKEVIDFKDGYWYGKRVRPEVEGFVEAFCSLILIWPSTMAGEAIRAFLNGNKQFFQYQQIIKIIV